MGILGTRGREAPGYLGDALKMGGWLMSRTVYWITALLLCLLSSFTALYSAIAGQGADGTMSIGASLKEAAIFSASSIIVGFLLVRFSANMMGGGRIFLVIAAVGVQLAVFSAGLAQVAGGFDAVRNAAILVSIPLVIVHAMASGHLAARSYERRQSRRG